MKPKLLFLPLLCLLLLLPPTIAQELEVGRPSNDVERQLNEIIVSRFARAFIEKDPAGCFMLVLSGRSILPGFNDEFGITNEQLENLNESMNSLQPKNWEEFQAKLYAIKEKVQEDANYNLTDEEDETIESMIEYVFEATNVSVADALTEEQIQKMDGMILALTGGLESPFFNEKHMNALEMTDEQREQFKLINEATKPGRDKLIDAISAETLKMMDTGKMDFKGLLGTFSKFREYSTDLKKRRMAILTDAQIARMKNLSRLPKFLSIANVLPQWVPGPNSWQPGDPIPGGVPTRPPGRFPRQKQ